jgi:hypothetical protein
VIPAGENSAIELLYNEIVENANQIEDELKTGVKGSG